MLASARLRSTFGRRDLGDPFWANVSLLLQPPSIDGAKNTFLDSSGNNYVITPLGTPMQVDDSPFTTSVAASVYLDGDGDYLSIPTAAPIQYGADNFTVELWFKAERDGVNQTLYSHQNYNVTNSGALSFIIVMLPNRNISVVLASSTTRYDFVADLPMAGKQFELGTWNHVAVVRDGALIKLYFNGAFINERNVGTVALNASALHYVGTYINLGASDYQWFKGNISNIRIVKGSVLYSSNFTPPPWPLEAVSGTGLLLKMENGKVYDKSLLENPITFVGDAQTSTAAPLAGMGSLAFDGAGDYLQVPGGSEFAFGTGDFTVECWAFPTALTSSAHVMASTYSATGWWFRFLDTSLQFGVYNTTLISVASATLNTWQHVAVCRAGTNLRLFVDGVQVGSTVQNSTNINDASRDLTVGYLRSDIAQAFVGKIADLRITKYARYSGNFELPTKPVPATAARVKWGAATGGTVIDQDGYRYHVFTSNGTLTVTKAGSLDVLAVGGGGGAGGGHSNSGTASGGGGGGELVTARSNAVVGNYQISVGTGGAGGSSGSVNGNNGATSSALGLVADSGKYSVSGRNTGVAPICSTGGDGGGSGGGSGGYYNGPGGAGGSSGASGQGSPANQPGGVGGGWDDHLGLVGTFISAGAGGAIVAASNSWYHGGGGGGGVVVNLPGISAVSGGNGTTNGSYAGLGGNGGEGYGAGGGGASGTNGAGGTGANGIVIVRYAI